MKNKDKEPKKTAAAAKPEEPRTQEFKLIPYDQVRRSEGNPRKTFDEAELKELASSILDQGIIQPLVVRAVPQKYTLHEPDLVCKTHYLVMDAALNEVYRAETESAAVLWAGGEEQFKPYYELLAGERRYRAAGIAGLKELPCMVRTADEIDAYKVRLMENDQRVNLSDLERAEHYRKGIEENGFTVESLMKVIDKSRSHIFGMLALLRLSEPLREALQAGKINKSIAERASIMPDPKQQAKFLKTITEKDGSCTISVRDADDLIARDYMVSLENCGFDLSDEELYPLAGPCCKCPKRTGNMLDMYPELKTRSPNICTDAPCFGMKKNEALQRVLDEAVKGGAVAVPGMGKNLFLSGHWLMHESGYVKVDDVCPADPKRRTYAQILKKFDPQVHAAIDKNNELQKLYSKSGITELLTKAGIKLEKAEAVQDEILPETSEEKRKRALASELAEAMDTGTGRALIEAVEKDTALTDKAQSKFWLRFLCVTMHFHNYHSTDWRRVFKRRGIPHTDEVINKLPWHTVRGICLEIMLIDGYGDSDLCTYDVQLLAAAVKAFDLDVKAVEKRIKAEFAEANRLPKAGEEIPYAGDVEELKACSVTQPIMEGKIPNILKFRGYRWVETGAIYGPDGDVYNMMRVVPAGEYSKPKFTYSQKEDNTDDMKETMGYEGIVGQFGKEEWVLTGPEFHFVVAKKPKAKAEKKTTKKKK